MVDIFEFAKNNNIESIEFLYDPIGEYCTIKIHKNGKTAFLSFDGEFELRSDLNFVIITKLRDLIKELEKES